MRIRWGSSGRKAGFICSPKAVLSGMIGTCLISCGARRASQRKASQKLIGSCICHLPSAFLLQNTVLSCLRMGNTGHERDKIDFPRGTASAFVSRCQNMRSTELAKQRNKRTNASGGCSEATVLGSCRMDREIRLRCLVLRQKSTVATREIEYTLHVE